MQNHLIITRIKWLGALLLTEQSLSMHIRREGGSGNEKKDDPASSNSERSGSYRLQRRSAEPESRDA